MTEPVEITVLLEAARRGDRPAEERLLAAVYEELRQLARRKVSGAPTGATLEPTALVHEAWVRLVGDSRPAWENRRHFFGAAAIAMRNILVEHARKGSRARRGGGARPGTLIDDLVAGTAVSDAEVLALDEALNELGRLDERKKEVVMLRFFAGLTIEETARALQVATGTVKHDWSFARAWLLERIRG